MAKLFLTLIITCLSTFCSGQSLQDKYRLVFPKADKGLHKVVTHDDQYGLIKLGGRVVVPAIYDAIDPFDIYKNKWARVQKDGLYGFVHKSGKVVVEPNYVSISAFGVVYKNYAYVQLTNGDFSMINKKGKQLNITAQNQSELNLKFKKK